MISEGNVIKDKYKIIKQLGQGGMAQVWLAEEVKMGDRQVAIKVPLPGMSDDENRILQARFQREVKVCAELVKAETPNIVKALTVEPYEDSDLLVIEYMPGGDLSQRIEKHPDGLPLEDVLQISEDILNALDAVHNHPLVVTHRDIKPSNILFNAKGKACLGDFGLAQMGRTSGALSQAIADQSMAFTPLYRAPELEKPGAFAMPYTDIFSYGCVVFEMLTGRLRKKFRPGTPPSQLRSEVPEWLDEIVLDSLMEDPWDRLQSAQEAKTVIKKNADSITKKPKRKSKTKKAEPKISFPVSEPRKQKRALKTTPSLGIGSTMVSEKDGMTMVYVPAGEFPMGTDDSDPDASEPEKPQHTVYLDAYWIDKTPVTNAMYARFLNEMGNQKEKGFYWLNVNTEYSDTKISQSNSIWRVEKGFEIHPVIDVNWYGARAYSQWAGKRLPTEAEWEKAARGTDGRTFPWGEGIQHDLANFGDPLEFGETSPVGHYPKSASPYGALDMAGNVWEGVQDWYDEKYYKNSPKKNPQGPSSGRFRVLRGGSWSDSGRDARSAYRGKGAPYLAGDLGGFRCALRAASP